MFTLFAIIFGCMLLAAVVIFMGCLVSLFPSCFAVIGLFALDGIVIWLIVRAIKKKK